MAVLSDYVTEVRRLLHDANGRFWETSELEDYINDARFRVAIDTGCLRFLDTSGALVTHQETYPLATLTSKGARAVDLVNLTILWGQQRIPLLNTAWTDFNARWRVWTNNYTRPSVWSRMGASLGTIYIASIPDQNYPTEVDVIYIPVPLVDDTTVEELVYPFTAPVAYYAAWKAKYKEQSYGEGEIFLQQYKMKAVEAINGVFTRMLPNAYA